MNHRISPQDDLILQTSLSVADDAYSLGSTFTLQDRVEAIEQSSEEFYQIKTIVAVLDCLISPRWPHPPCLPSDIVPCLSWQQLKDTPTHFHVTYDILESDVNGRLPDEAEYECTPKSCYYNLAKHCQQTVNKVDKISSAIPVINC